MSALDGTDIPVDFHAGASWKGKQAVRLRPCSREIKLLRAICAPCEDLAGGAVYLEPGWVENCPHDPYVTVREQRITRPVYEDIDDARGPAPVEPEAPQGAEVTSDAWQAYQEALEAYAVALEAWEASPVGTSGRRRITGTETVSEWVATPNWVSITHAGGMNKGKGVDRALRRGFIYPQQLRSPSFPNGIKMRCMFRECYRENLKQYRNGWFCREVEAKLVKVSDSEETWEVGQFSLRSDKIQAQILDRQVV